MAAAAPVARGGTECRDDAAGAAAGAAAEEEVLRPRKEDGDSVLDRFLCWLLPLVRSETFYPELLAYVDGVDGE